MGDFDLSPISRTYDAIVQSTSPADIAVQMAFAVASIGLAWMLARGLCARLPSSNRWKFGKGDFERVAFPFFALMLGWASRVVLGHYQDTDTGPLEIVNSLLFAFLMIRLTTYILGHVLPEGGLQRATIRIVVFLFWVVVILHLVGMLPEIQDILDAHGITVGKDKHEITLLDLAKAVIALFAAITIALWISRVTETRVMAAESVEMTTKVVIGRVVRITTIFIAIFVALPFAGIDITTLSIFTGAIGVGLGFGLQKIASNYVSGFIVLLDRSLRIGDVVTIDGRRGEVQAIRSRYTVLKGSDGVESIIPNETLITTSVQHHTYSDPKISIVIPVTVTYDSDVQRACDLLVETATRHKRVIADPPAGAKVKALGPNGVELELTVWIADAAVGEGDLRSDLLKEVLSAYRQAAIQVPYAMREVRLIATPETPKNPSTSMG